MQKIWLGIATTLRTFADTLREDRTLRGLVALFEFDGELLAC